MKRNKGRCELTAQRKNGRTVISDSYYTSPFKIMNPFQDGKKTKVIVMTASAGMLAGDDYYHKYQIQENTDLTVTGQGYTKIFNTKEDFCTNRVDIELKGNAIFRYLPYPTIPFPGADYQGMVTVKLEKESTFIYTDILSAGRVERDELFQMKRYHNQLQIILEDRLVFLDRMVLEPQKINYRTIGFFGEYTHTGMMYIYRQKGLDSLIHEIRKKKLTGQFGVTHAKEGILIRALACKGEELENFFSEIVQMI